MQSSRAETRAPYAAHPFRHRDFRVLCLSTMFQGAGYVGETVVLGWLLLEDTDSALIVGLGIALRALPNFLLGIPGGAIADRLDRRALLRWVSLGSGVITALLAALALAGMLSVPALLSLTFLGGGLRALGQSARQSYAFDIAGPLQAVGAMALTKLAQCVGGIAGSLGAGLILDRSGGGEAYLAVSISLLLSSAAMLFARSTGQSAPKSQTPILQGSRDYLSEMASNRTLAVIVGLTAAVEVLGFSYQAALPNLTRDLLNAGPEALGLLSASGSVGSILTVVALSARGEPGHKGSLFIAVLLGFGIALCFLGSGTSLVLAMIAIAFVAGFASLTDVLTQTLVQSAVPNELRGRAMGSWVLAVGFGPAGHLQIGVLIALFGVTAALSVNGALLALLAVLTALRARRVRAL
jgi:MFS family permease